MYKEKSFRVSAQWLWNKSPNHFKLATGTGKLLLCHCWKFPKILIRHQGWQVLKVVSPDKKFPAQMPQENSSPETAKQAGRAGKQLGVMYRVQLLVQGARRGGGRDNS